MNTRIRHYPRRVRGFSLIEVLIALAVLAVGLLGVGLMQTLNLRYTRSADQRSKAVNLAQQLTDMARSNRSQLSDYTAITAASFSGVTVPTGSSSTGCVAPTQTFASYNMTYWRCLVRDQLGPDATADVTTPAANQLQVTVNWGDAATGADNTTVGGTRSVTLRTQL